MSSDIPQFEGFQIQGQRGRYQIMKCLGTGNFGLVHLGEMEIADPQSPYRRKLVAIKIVSDEKIKTNQKLEELFQQEIKSLSIIRSPNVVNLEEYIQTNIEGQLYRFVIMRYVTGIPMQNLMEKDSNPVGAPQQTYNPFYVNNGKKVMREDKAIFAFKQLCSGLSAMHKVGIAHRDLKPANIMIEGDQYVIIDLGFSKQLSSEQELAGTRLGTPVYMPYEILRGEPYNPFQADVYSLGVIFFQMLFGCYPYAGKNPVVLVHNMDKGFNETIFNSQPVSCETKDLLRRMLHPDFRQRITFPEIYKHRIFQEAELRIDQSQIVQTNTWAGVDAQQYQNIAAYGNLQTISDDEAMRVHANQNGGGGGGGYLQAYQGNAQIVNAQEAQARAREAEQLLKVQRDADYAMQLYYNEWNILEVMIRNLDMMYKIPADLLAQSMWPKLFLMKRLFLTYQLLLDNLYDGRNEFNLTQDAFARLKESEKFKKFREEVERRQFTVETVFRNMIRDIQRNISGYVPQELNAYLNDKWQADLFTVYKQQLADFTEEVLMACKQSREQYENRGVLLDLQNFIVDISNCILIDENFRKEREFDFYNFFNWIGQMTNDQKMQYAEYKLNEARAYLSGVAQQPK